MSPYGYMGGQQADFSLSQLRLDTEPLKKRIELYLRGKDVQLSENERGELVEKVVVIGEPKMNDKGIQDVMWIIDSFFNQHMVQGNMKEENQRDMTYDFHCDLSVTAMVKKYDWGMNIHDYDMIIDTIVIQFYVYTTRTIDDGERKALVPTMQHIERYSPEKPESQGLIGSVKNLWGGGK